MLCFSEAKRIYITQAVKVVREDKFFGGSECFPPSIQTWYIITKGVDGRETLGSALN